MSRSFTDTKFIVDRGFFSEAVLTMMSENGNCYIIPLMSSNKDVKRIKKTLHYTTTFPIDETIHPIHPSFEADRAS